MSSGVRELQKYTAVSKYARFVEELQRRETWGETVVRYRGMLQQKYPDRADQVAADCEAVERFEVMPSMRGLQFGGPPIFQHNGRLYNCAGSCLDRLRFFAEAFYLLLCGSGAGFSVQERHLRHLPRFSKKRLAGVKLPRKKFKPADTIEGWADTASVLMSAYHEEPVVGFEDYHECEPSFDFTGIRREGSKLSFGIGRAPGPMPLRNANERVRRLLHRAVAEGLEKLNSVVAYDIGMHYSDAVISGGVRRSATIVLFDLWDELMLRAKTGNWRATNPQRARSNNSAICVRGSVQWEDFKKLFESTRQFGEPGFYWVDDPDGIPNPCVEIGFWPFLEVERGAPDAEALTAGYQGPVLHGHGNEEVVRLSGWQMCNLTTINAKTLPADRPAKDEEFLRRCEIASRLGTWQAGFATFPYLGPVSDRIVQKEALLGVSIAGVMHHPDALLDPQVLRAGASRVLLANASEARAIGINPAARATCVKPDGNSASALGSFSGCHGGKFRRGMRLAQANKNEAPYQHFKSVNPRACEASKWSANGTDDVVRFPVEYEGLMESDLTAVEFLGHVRTLQTHWVEAGKVTERCSRPWLSHNVSNTVRVRDDEWGAVAHDIYQHQFQHSGVSFISVYGDRDYAQAPFTGVHDPDEQEGMYGKESLLWAPKLVDFALAVFPDLWDACDLVLDGWDLTARTPTEDQGFVREAVLGFAQAYFAGDRRKATYCLKDYWNWRKYQELKETYREVDYSLMVEKDGAANFQGEVACAGGACES
jgi:ribonucleoside-triphosphate reductase